MLEDAEFLEQLCRTAVALAGLRGRLAGSALRFAAQGLALVLRQEFFQDIPPSANLCRRLQTALRKNDGAGEIIPLAADGSSFLIKMACAVGKRRPATEGSAVNGICGLQPCLLLPEYSAFLLACREQRDLRHLENSGGGAL